jgi:hypothetical protein
MDEVRKNIETIRKDEKPAEKNDPKFPSMESDRRKSKKVRNNGKYKIPYETAESRI